MIKSTKGKAMVKPNTGMRTKAMAMTKKEMGGAKNPMAVTGGSVKFRKSC